MVEVLLGRAEQIERDVGAAAGGLADDVEILSGIAGDDRGDHARPEDLAQVFQRLALASDRDDAARAHAGGKHHRARAEIAGRAIDQDGLAAGKAGTLDAAERHDQLGEADQLRGGLVVEI